MTPTVPVPYPPGAVRRKRVSAVAVALAVLALSTLAAPVMARTLYVDSSNVQPNPDGSIGNPFVVISAAMSAALSGDTVQVLPGTYAEVLTLKSGVNLLGAGATLTTLQGNGTAPVVTANAVVTGTRIEGFRITGGGGTSGAGVRSLFGSPTIANNVIEGNTAIGTAFLSARGGGIYLYQSGAQVLDNIVRDNDAGTSADGRGGLGGGIFSRLGTPRISRNVISGNTALASFDAYSAYVFGYGGGLEIQLSAATVTDNQITGNVAGLGGGGIDVYGGSSVVMGNTIDGNRAQPPAAAPPGFSYGGGMTIVATASPIFLDNLVTSNVARDGGGGVDVFPHPGPATLRYQANDVFGNLASLDPATDETSGLRLCADTSPANPRVPCLDDSRCQTSGGAGVFVYCLQGGIGVAGNVSVSPVYVASGNGDFRLAAGSPAMDTGRNGLLEFASGPDTVLGTADDQLTLRLDLGPLDLAGSPRAIDGNADGIATVDLGAFERLGGLVGDRDGDWVPNETDQCPEHFDPAQPDADGDGRGDACDLCPVNPDPDQTDTDGDRRGDACDPDDDNDQILDDGDGSGTAGDAPCAHAVVTGCDDNCPTVSNPSQFDTDADTTGDSCDCADTDPLIQEPPGEIDTLTFAPGSSTLLQWNADPRAARYHLYRGTWANLLLTWDYTQDPALVPGAAQFCDLMQPSVSDTFAPANRQLVFYLATGENVCGESSLGRDSAALPRLNASPCP